MTIFVPRAWRSAIAASTARVAAGSRLAVGSSRNSTSGSSAHARARARRCCSPPDSTRAGCCASAARPTARAPPRARRRARARRRRRGAARSATLAERRAAQHAPALEHHRLARAAPLPRHRPAHRCPRWARAGRGSRRSSTLLPAPLAPSTTCAGRRSMRSDHRVDDRPAAGGEDDAVELERQDRRGHRASAATCAAPLRSARRRR